MKNLPASHARSRSRTHKHTHLLFHYRIFIALNLSDLFLLTDVSEDDIKLVMEQAQVNRAQAIKALQEHGCASEPLSLALACILW